jgi:multiple sugar transport system substrate-binding protein
MKRWTLIVAMLLLIGLLAACGAPAAPAPDAGAAETAADPGDDQAASTGSGDKKKVVIFIGMGTGTDPDQIAAQEDLQARFNSTHDDIEVEFMIVPNDEAVERFLAMQTGGNPPQLVGPNGISTVAQFYESWLDVTPFIDADALDTSDFFGPAVELNTYPDKVVGLPLGLFPSFIFYNADMFDAAGLEYPPADYDDTSWTYDKLREVAIQLTLDENGNNATSPDFDPENIVQWGFDDAWTDGRGLLTRWGAPSIGRPMTEDYKTATANAEEWVYGLDWFNKGVWEDRFIPDATIQAERDSSGVDPFGSNQVAMFYSHTWFMPEGLVDLPFGHGIAAAPFNQQGERIARIHADTFTIPKTAENQEEAWEVLKWLTAPEQIVDVCLVYGCIPARKSVEAAYTEQLAERYPGLDYDVIFKSIDYLDDPNHESFVPEWGRVSDIMTTNVGAVYQSPIDAQALLDQTNAEIQAVLDEYWAGQ